MLMPHIKTKVKFNKPSTTEHVVTLKHDYYLTMQNWHEKPPDWNDDDGVQPFWSRLIYLSGCSAW